ncbi:MAG TPA: ParB/RepB/Spo0J family partition protein [Acidobacteriaceae bacterium]
MSQQESGRRRALGKGLESLLPRITEVTPAPAVAAPTSSVLDLRLDQIDRSPFQTRTRFDDRLLVELGASIAATGVVQPILVRPVADGRYQLIAGERRWLASKLVGKVTIPAVVRQASDGQAMEMTIVENLQRADLNPMEQARAYDRLGREFLHSQEEMAQRTGKDRATVANFLRLLRLPEAIQERVEAGDLSFGHARALLALEDPALTMRAAQKVLALSMSVRQTESYVKGLLDPRNGAAAGEEKAKTIDPNVRHAQEELQRALGMRVTIEDHHGRGRVIIEYARLEEFDGLMEMLARP